VHRTAGANRVVLVVRDRKLETHRMPVLREGLAMSSDDRRLLCVRVVRDDGIVLTEQDVVDVDQVHAQATAAADQTLASGRDCALEQRDPDAVIFDDDAWYVCAEYVDGAGRMVEPPRRSVWQ
jgi:hypothetical protein